MQAKAALLAATIVGTLSLLAGRSETLSGLAHCPTLADTAGAPALSALARTVTRTRPAAACRRSWPAPPAPAPAATWSAAGVN